MKESLMITEFSFWRELSLWRSPI